MTDDLVALRAWVARRQRDDRWAPFAVPAVALVTALAWPGMVRAANRAWHASLTPDGDYYRYVDGSQTLASCVAFALAAALLVAAGLVARRVAGARAAAAAWGVMAVLAACAFVACLDELRALPTIPQKHWSQDGPLRGDLGLLWGDLRPGAPADEPRRRELVTVAVAFVLLALGGWIVGRAPPRLLSPSTMTLLRRVGWIASAALLVVASWRLATRPGAADYTRGLPAVGRLPAYDETRVPVPYRVSPRPMRCSGLRCRHDGHGGHRLPFGGRRYLGEPYWTAEVDLVFEGVVLRRVCDERAICLILWTRSSRRAREDAQWFLIDGTIRRLAGPEEVTVRYDAAHRMLVIDNGRLALGAIPLDADAPRWFTSGLDPQPLEHPLDVPWHDVTVAVLPGAVAPPWQYVALAAAGLAVSLALAWRRRARELVVRGATASHDGRGTLRLADGERVEQPSAAHVRAGPVVVIETRASDDGPYRGGNLRLFEVLAVSARQVAAWEAAAACDRTLGPVAVLALTHAPLGAAAALGLVF